MKLEIICKTCQTPNIVIENRLFFSGEIRSSNIICPICKDLVAAKETDGWFFVQTKEQYIFQLEIERQKEGLKYKGIISI